MWVHYNQYDKKWNTFMASREIFEFSFCIWEDRPVGSGCRTRRILTKGFFQILKPPLEFFSKSIASHIDNFKNIIMIILANRILAPKRLGIDSFDLIWRWVSLELKGLFRWPTFMCEQVQQNMVNTTMRFGISNASSSFPLETRMLSASFMQETKNSPLLKFLSSISIS